jgi:hypothetical protein
MISCILCFSRAALPEAQHYLLAAWQSIFCSGQVKLTLAPAFITHSRTLQVLRSLLADADTATATAAATGTAALREGRTGSAAGSSASAAEGSLLAAGTVAEQQQRRAAVDARRHELQYLQGEGASLAALALAQVHFSAHHTSLFVIQRFASVVCTYEVLGYTRLASTSGIAGAAVSINCDVIGTTMYAIRKYFEPASQYSVLVVHTAAALACCNLQHNISCHSKASLRRHVPLTMHYLMQLRKQLCM